MKLKYFSLFLLLLLSINYATAQGSTCELPAPDSLVNTADEPMFISYTFSPVQGATGYQVSISYPSGTSTQTFQLNDPNASSFSATVLPQTRIVRIAPMVNECVCPKYAEHISGYTLIIVDLIAGVSPPNNINDPLCIKDELTYNLIFNCEVNNSVGSSYCLEFLDGAQLVQVKLINETTTSGGPKIEVKKCSDQTPGWVFSDDFNPASVAGPYAVNNSSLHFYMTKGTNESNRIKIEVSASGTGGNQNSLSILRKDRTPARITNVKIYQNNDESDVRSDNQSTQSSNDYKVTPNPFSDHLNITIDTPEKGEVVVNLFDVTGSLRKSVTLPTNELDNQNYTIATSDLLSGMYIMQVRTSAGVQQVSKVFKL